MKKNHLSHLVLSLLLLISLLLPVFTSCTPSTPPEETTAESVSEPASSESGSETANPDRPTDGSVILADGSEVVYALLRADTAGSDVVRSSVEITTLLKEKHGTSPRISTDWSLETKDQETVESPDPEILIGLTKRPESQKAFAELTGDNDYLIRIDGNKIVIVGKTDAATVRACEFFLAHAFVQNDSVSFVPAGFSYLFSPMDPDSVCRQLTDNYSLIRSETSGERVTLAYTLTSNALKMLCNATIRPKTDFTIGDYDKVNGIVNSNREVLIGETNRKESIDARKGLSPLDYRIQVSGNKVVAVGGSSFATAAAAQKLLSLLSTGEIYDLSLPFSYEFIFTDHYTLNPYALDPSSFTPVWEANYTPPAYVNDEKECIYTLTHPSGRIAVISHRGDFINYPENSVEAYLSAVFIGADILEIDVRLTKDNIPVMMHDDTLKRTTNVEQFLGKDGFPSSMNLSDWTYEQLTHLSLKTESGTVTSYKIPTLYEVLLACGGKVQLRVDNKTVSDACAGVFANTKRLDWNTDIFDYAVATNATTCFFHNAGLSLANTWKTKLADNAEYMEMYKFFVACMNDGYGFRKSFAFWNDPRYSSRSTRDITLGNEKTWALWISEGSTLFWTNRVVACCQYIQRNYTGSNYSSIQIK